ncbi:hypothetical protein AMTRI_Chr10g225400 [Amborella trichopoda]
MAASPKEEHTCYACTQAGAPAFHSISCEHTNGQLHWDPGSGSHLIPIKPSLSTVQPHRARAHGTRKVLDPRSPKVQKWNRAVLLVRALALAIDPLFFYSLTVARERGLCLYMNWKLAGAVMVLRTSADAFHVGHIWTQFRLAYLSRESLVVGCGRLVWDPRAVASHYVRSLKGFWFDLFVVLPVPQAVFWFVVPGLIEEEKMKEIMTILLLIIMFQYLPKVYHSHCLMKRMQNVTGYLFGTIWWGFALNLIAYFIASHAAGGCWYVLSIQRVASCVKRMCEMNGTCDLVPLACSKKTCGGVVYCASNRTATIPGPGICLNEDGPFRYGIYRWALPVVTSPSLAVKILYPIFWGLMTLSTFGNDLEPTSQWLEVIFSIIMVLSGLLLFTLLIGNIQVFLHGVMAKKRMMQRRVSDMEWWMKRRQLPSRLRQRVRHYEQQKWATMKGEDEMEMIKDLPQGLRRDIKRHLCLDLIKQVPLFKSLDDLILDNICDRVRPLVFSKEEKIITEGDPVQRMVFIVKGHLKRSQKLSKGMTATCTLGPGNFLGDELFSWCLRRPFVDRLPPSSATFVSLEPTEAFALEAPDLKYITEHFRYKFANERLKRTARYYSSNWRTWAAVNIQLAWRKHKKAMTVTIVAQDDERRLRRYASMFLSLRPHDHLE